MDDRTDLEPVTAPLDAEQASAGNRAARRGGPPWGRRSPPGAPGNDRRGGRGSLRDRRAMTVDGRQAGNLRAAEIAAIPAAERAGRAWAGANGARLEKHGAGRLRGRGGG